MMGVGGKKFSCEMDSAGCHFVNDILTSQVSSGSKLFHGVAHGQQRDVRQW